VGAPGERDCAGSRHRPFCALARDQPGKPPSSARVGTKRFRLAQQWEDDFIYELVLSARRRSRYAGAMAGLEQTYSCGTCHYAGSVQAPANAPHEVLVEAAQSDHAEHSPDCADPSIQLGSSSAAT
jgi:hypothetical protein